MIDKDKGRRGLSPAEVSASRARYGSNVISKKRRAGFWRHFFANLGDPVIKVLLLALGVNLIFLFRSHNWFETAGIAVSVLLATMISTVSEYGSEAAFARLSELCSAAHCRVRRGQLTEIDVSDVVVGDIVLLAAGERIPADGVVLTGSVTVDQAPLTGESREVKKEPAGGAFSADPTHTGAVFAGTTVQTGSAEIEVCAVGDRTLLGSISGELQGAGRESPLKRRLAELAAQISRIGYVAAVICALAFLFHALVIDANFSRVEMLSRVRDLPFLFETLLHALMLGLTVVVVAVPEGLPMMIAVVLSSNIRRMTRDNVLVRRPAGIEAAGSMNILFTDKTGTLTTGRLSVCRILTVSEDFADVSALKRGTGELFSVFSMAVHAAAGATRGMRDGAPAAIGGNGTDRALLQAFLHENAPDFSVAARVAFDSDRKYGAARLSDGRAFFIGAPERLMPYVSTAYGAKGTVPFSKPSFLSRIAARTRAGERVVLVCMGDTMPADRPGEALTLLAAVAFSDPLRPEARATVERLRGAGVQVVMMTGDSKETAARIAASCGILRAGGVCLEAAELAQMSDSEVTEILPRLAVLSRALPADKSRLVRLCAAVGLVVGMTGDGINDAPALKEADVGFAMGSGTQVAKEAGDVVILDDNLASIARAVLYGRTIFKSIRKFITLQLVMNFCAVGISIIGPFIGFDAPVTVVQMLWINIIMDTLGGLAFAGEAPMPHYMKEPPKKRSEPILTRGIAARIASLSIYTVVLSVFFLKFTPVVSLFRPAENNIYLLTAFFALFIFAGVFNCFNARSDRVAIFAGLSRNPAFILIMLGVATVQIAFVYLGGVLLRTVPLFPRELAVALCLALTVIPFGWIDLVRRRLSGKRDLY